MLPVKFLGRHIPIRTRMKACMNATTHNKTISLGFLTVRHHPIHGYFGGYLIVNSQARPLEFHCTLPIQPTRAQQILYGNTLQEFVCGEQIARALVTKAKATPQVLLADTFTVLTLRHIQSIPMAAIDCSNDELSSLPRSHCEREDYFRFKAFGQHFSVLPEFADDADSIQDLFETDKSPLDLLEPFGRIEEALMEAHPATKAA
jgi:hypothetical protein